VKPTPIRRSMPRTALLLGIGLLATTIPVAGASAADPGQLDGAFGGSGVVELPSGTTVSDVVLQPDGKVLVTGTTGGFRGARMMVARYNADGTLDRSFGAGPLGVPIPPLTPDGGIVTIPLPSGASRTSGDAIALAPDGKIVLAGDRFAPIGADGMFVARLSAAGDLDTSFGEGGTASIDRAAVAGEANDVAIRPDGSIVLGGAGIGTGPEPVASIAQLTAAGTPGPATQHYEVGQGTVEGIALQSDGKVVFVGTRRNDQIIEAIIGRANADGTVDTSFGGGVVKRGYARGAASSGLRDVAALADGSVLATGYAFEGSGAGVRQISVRFTNAGAPQSGFGTDGVVYTDAAKSSTINTNPPGGGAALAVDGARVYLGGSWDEGAISALSVQAQTTSGGGTGGGTPGGGTPGGGTGSGGGTTTVASVSGVKLSRSSVSRKRKTSTTLTYRLSADAKLRLSVQLVGKGRRSGSKCVKATTKNRRAKACTLLTTVKGTKTLSGKKGTNRLTIKNAKPTSTTLRPGTYRLSLQPLDGRKLVGKAKTATLKVTS